MIDEHSPLGAAGFGIGLARAIGLHVGLTEAGPIREGRLLGDFHVHLHPEGLYVLPHRPSPAGLYKGLFPTGKRLSDKRIEPDSRAIEITKGLHEVTHSGMLPCPACGYTLSYRFQPYPTEDIFRFLQHSLVVLARPHSCLAQDPSIRLGPGVLAPTGPPVQGPDYLAMTWQLLGTTPTAITYQGIKEFLIALGWVSARAEPESPHLVALIDEVLRQRFPT